MQFSDKGIALLKNFEGFKAKKYQDIVGIWTIGYGTLWKPGMPEVVTPDEAVELLKGGIAWAQAAVNNYVTVPLTQNQFDALVCFVYNIGNMAFKNSTMLRHLNAKEYRSAADEFGRWDKAGGVVVQGLHNRRIAEMELFLEID